MALHFENTNINGITGILEPKDEELNVVLDSVMDGIAVTNADGLVTDCNHSFLEMFGYNRKEDVIGTEAHLMIFPADYELMTSDIRSRRTRKKVVDIECTLKRADGSTFVGELRLSEMKDSTGSFSGFVTIVRDLTDKKRMEADLRESEEYIYSLIDAMDDIVFTYDLDGNFTEFHKINETVQRDMDRHNVSFVGKAYRDILPEYLSAKMDGAFKKAIESGLNQHFDYTIKVNDIERWYDARVSPLKDSTGVITGLLVVSRDITERVKAEKSLADSEGRFRSLLNSMEDVVISFDLSGTYTNVHQPGRENSVVSGTSPIVGKKYFEVLPVSVADKLQKAYRKLLQTGENQQFDYWLNNKSEDRCYNAMISPLVDAEGQITGITTVSRDITERKRMETIIEKAAREWRATFDALTEHIYLIDTDFRIVKVNRMLSSRVGATPKAMLGKRCFKVLHNRNSVCPGCSVAEVTKTRKQVIKDMSSKEDGSFYQVVTSPIWDEKGDISAFINSARDISEIKKIEEQLKQSQLLASLGTMTAGIAHEVNNPLGSVLLLSELLLKEESTESIKQDLRVIHNEAKRAAKIMSTLLTYRTSTVTTNRRLNLNRIVRKVAEMRQYSRSIANIDLETNIPETPYYVKGDYSRLIQMFINVFINAEESLSSRSGGFIKLEVKKDRNWVKVIVSDNGQGIPEENLASIFHPFFTTKSVGEGTGLGLSTSYSIATSHEGLIRAENNEMGGATITIELPLARGAAKKTGKRTGNDNKSNRS